MRRWLLAGAAGAGLVGDTAAGPVPPAAVVVRLGAPDYADREAATRFLLAAGPGVVPALEAGARSGNPEVARRAAEVLARVRLREDSARLTAPKAVRLSYRAVPLGVAVADLRDKTGLPLALAPDGVADPDRPITCETGELPAWEAVAAFARAAGLREVFAAEVAAAQPDTNPLRSYHVPPPPPPAADTVPVVLADGPGRDLPGSRATTVRVLALPPAFPGTRTVLGSGEVTLQLDVTPAPGMNWQDGAAVRVVRVVDEYGRGGAAGPTRPPAVTPFAEFVPAGGLVVGGRGGVIVGKAVVMRWDPDGLAAPQRAAVPNPRVLPVPVVVPTRHARVLRRLEGAVTGTIVVPGAVLAAIDDPAGSVGTPVDGVAGARLTVLGWEAGGGRHPEAVRVRVEVPSPWQEARRRNPWGGPLMPEPARPEGFTAQVHGVDAAGRLVGPVGGTSTTSDDGLTLTTVSEVLYPAGGKPARLVLTGPKPVPVEVPFVLENVPLP